MEKKISRLYPPPYQEQALAGLYLNHAVHELGSLESPFVYANFLTSLDGRIAIDDKKNGISHLPKGITTPSDFRLFLELQAQADCLITHGGYLRTLAEGRLGNILQVGLGPESKDLKEWRKKRGFDQQPAIIITSASLDFPMPESINAHGQTVTIATGEAANRYKVNRWRKKGYRVIFAGRGNMVEGGPLVDALGSMGYQTLYLIAGPRILDTMVRDGKLSRLYQTISHRLVGGESFHSLLPGPELGAVGNMQLRSLYYDSASPEAVGQWFAQFDS